MTNLDNYQEMYQDYLETLDKSIEIKSEDIKKINIFKKLIVMIVDFLSPLL